jgi:hypothetical protein
MSLAKRLRDYRIGRFTDEDVVRCTGLSERGWRELIKFGVVRTLTENVRGRGHVRLCDATVFKRAATIAALNRAGFSLAVAGRIAYFLPFRTTLFDICDPGNVSLKGTTDTNTCRALPLRLRRANANWFNPKQPAKADPKVDWLVQIYDRRFVSIMYRPAEKPVVFGDLRNEGARFVAWVPHDAKSHFARSAVAQLAIEWAPAGERLPNIVSEWEEPTKSARELGSLGYNYQKLGADDPLRRAAESAVRNPLFTTTINISLAIRRAIRCYLGMEQLAPAPATEVRDQHRPAKHRRRSGK